MTNEKLIQMVPRIVREKQGCKGVELVVGLTAENIAADKDDIDEAITTAKNRGYIIEIEYILPDMPYRIKSMFFPLGTEFKDVL
jgi:predicted ABC-type ATPase